MTIALLTAVASLYGSQAFGLRRQTAAPVALMKSQKGTYNPGSDPHMYEERAKAENWDCENVVSASYARNVNQTDWEDFLRFVMHAPLSAVVAKKKATQSTEPVRVFECGCGAGGVLRTLAKIFPDEKFVFTGVDRSQTQLAIAKRCLQASSSLSVGNCADLRGVATQSADLALSVISGMRYSPSEADRSRQLTELLRIAAPSGAVVVAGVEMVPGEAPDSPQCTAAENRKEVMKVPHKWWVDSTATMSPLRSLHFMDETSYRSQKFLGPQGQSPCTYGLWASPEVSSNASDTSSQKSSLWAAASARGGAPQ